LAAAAGNPLYQQVNEIIDTYVRPALAGDGGAMDLVDIDGKVVKIRYQGACGSCPTSTGATLSAVQNLLQEKVDPDLTLEPV